MRYFSEKTGNRRSLPFLRPSTYHVPRTTRCCCCDRFVLCAVSDSPPVVTAVSCDQNNNKRIEYAEFLRGVAGPINERRMSLIKRAFAKLDKDQSGKIDLGDIASLYNTSKHPEVITGKKTQQQVYNEFLRGFVDPNDRKAQTDGVPITIEEWVSYYADISASIPNDDDLFAAVVCSAWGITEGPAAPLAQNDLAKFIATVKEKIRQKAKGKNEKVFMRNTFKFFDLDRSNTVSYSEFLYALEKFGVMLDEKVRHVTSRHNTIDTHTSHHSITTHRHIILTSHIPCPARGVVWCRVHADCLHHWTRPETVV